MDIGNKLRELRLSKNLTIQDVADRIGVSKTTLMRWENGATQKMPSKKISLLAKVLGVHPMYIICGEERYLEPNQPSQEELIKLFNQMTIKQQVSLLSYAYKLLEEQENV